LELILHAALAVVDDAEMGVLDVDGDGLAGVVSRQLGYELPEGLIVDAVAALPPGHRIGLFDET
jgi:hypothetical protein